MTSCFSGPPVKPACIYLFIYLFIDTVVERMIFLFINWWQSFSSLVWFFLQSLAQHLSLSRLIRAPSECRQNFLLAWRFKERTAAGCHYTQQSSLHTNSITRLLWCCLVLIHVSWLLTSSTLPLPLTLSVLMAAMWMAKCSVAELNHRQQLLCNNFSTLMWTQRVAPILLHLFFQLVL